MAKRKANTTCCNFCGKSKVSFRQQCMISWNNHALLPKAYNKTNDSRLCSQDHFNRVQFRPDVPSCGITHNFAPEAVPLI